MGLCGALLESLFRRLSSREESLSAQMTLRRAVRILGMGDGSWTGRVGQVFWPGLLGGREEVGRRHRELLRANHPDCGGSAFLMGRINEARQFLDEWKKWLHES